MPASGKTIKISLSFFVLITLLKPIFLLLRYWANQKIVVAVVAVAAAAVVLLQIKTSKEEEFFKGKSVHERAAWL